MTTRTWTNPEFAGTLEDACAHAATVGGYTRRIGFEVEGMGERAGERHTLLPQYDSAGLPPSPGDVVTCSALGGASTWRVVRVADGYPDERKPHGGLAIIS